MKYRVILQASGRYKVIEGDKVIKADLPRAEAYKLQAELIAAYEKERAEQKLL